MFDNRVFLIDKPAGITSFDTVSRVRRILKLKKIGHSGTLDKFASGLLVVCSGKATKLTRLFLESDKRYTAEIKLGISTSTLDSEGEVTDERPADNITEKEIIKAISNFNGEISQLPPDYSSLKIKGRRASDLVREGKKVELKERIVNIYGIDILDIDIEDALINIDVRCSKGTYIRSLARDIGSILETGAFLKNLRRTESGKFSVEDAASLDTVQEFTEGCNVDRNFIVKPVDSLSEFSRVMVNHRAAAKIVHGALFDKNDILEVDKKEKNLFIIIDENMNLIAIAEIDFGNWEIKYLNTFNQI